MGLASDVASEFSGGILLFFQIAKWIIIVLISCSIAFGLWWVLKQIGFFNMFKKKTKKKGKKK